MSDNVQAVIHFDYEMVSFRLASEKLVTQWLELIAQKEQKKLAKLSYVFCTDESLYRINLKYLNHDQFTDIITFPYSYDPIQAEIFISIDRVRENAVNYKNGFERELYRVIVHGLLHMCGYDDKNEKQALIMRAKEDECLSALNLD